MVKRRRTTSTPRTPKQKWHYERNYFNYGRLKAMVETIDQIISAHSTLPDEVPMLKRAQSDIQALVFLWNNEDRRAKSEQCYTGGNS